MTKLVRSHSPILLTWGEIRVPYFCFSYQIIYILRQKHTPKTEETGGGTGSRLFKSAESSVSIHTALHTLEHCNNTYRLANRPYCPLLLILWPHGPAARVLTGNLSNHKFTIKLLMPHKWAESCLCVSVYWLVHLVFSFWMEWFCKY